MAKIIQDITSDVEEVFVTNIDAVGFAAKLLRSKVLTLQQVAQSKECKFALEILWNSNSSESNVKKAEDLIISMIFKINFKNREVEDWLFDEILKLPLNSQSPTFARIIQALAAKYLTKIQIKNHKSRRLIPLLLEFARNHETACITSNFWTQFCETKPTQEWIPVLETLTTNLAESLRRKKLSMDCGNEKDDDRSVNIKKSRKLSKKLPSSLKDLMKLFEKSSTRKLPLKSFLRFIKALSTLR